MLSFAARVSHLFVALWILSLGLLPAGVLTPVQADTAQLTPEALRAATIRKTTDQIWFEKNTGQYPSEVLYGFRNSYGALAIYPNKLRVSVRQWDKAKQQDGQQVVEITFPGANAKWTVTPEKPSPVIASYHTPSGDTLRPEVYGEVTLKAVYPGIDLRLKPNNAGELIFDWQVADPAHADKIKLAFNGQDKLRQKQDGSVILKLRHQDLLFTAPKVAGYQDGIKLRHTGKATMRSAGNHIGYNVDDIASVAQALEIKPALHWQTNFGRGSNTLLSQAENSAAEPYIALKQTALGSPGYSPVPTSDYASRIYRLAPDAKTITAWTMAGQGDPLPLASLASFPDLTVEVRNNAGETRLFSADLLDLLDDRVMPKRQAKPGSPTDTDSNGSGSAGSASPSTLETSGKTTSKALNALVPLSCDGTFYTVTAAATVTINSISRVRRPWTTSSFATLPLATVGAVHALGYNPVDNFLYAITHIDKRLIKIDAKGNTTIIPITGMVATTPKINAFTFSDTGLGYFYDVSDHRLYSLNAATGVATPIGVDASQADLGDIAFNKVDGKLYGINNVPARKALVLVDPTTAIVTPIGPTKGSTVGQNFGSLFFDGNGTLYAYQNTGVTHRIDLASGAASKAGVGPAISGSDGASCIRYDSPLDNAPPMALAPPVVPVPSTALPVRVIANSSFEVPSIGTITGYPGYGAGNAKGANYSDVDVPNWNTTSGTFFSAFYNYTYTAPIEFWRRNTGASTFDQPSAAAGVQYIELNSFEAAAVYQDLCLIQGETIGLTVQHRARGTAAADATTTNTMRMFISDPALWTGKLFTGTPNYTSGTLTAGTTAWTTQTGSWTNTVATQKFRFAFEAISGTSGVASLGNFLDDVQITLAPTVEFSATDVANSVNLPTHAEDNIYYVTLRVNGNMQSAGTVDISLGPGSTVDRNDYTLGTPVSGTGGAVRAGVTASKNAANGTVTVTIPAGIYDINAPADYITVPLNFADTVIEATETANFTLGNLTGGGSAGANNLILGSGVCNPLTSLSVTVADNDIDLRVTKTDGQTTAAQGNALSYTVTVTNQAGTGGVGTTLTAIKVTDTLPAALTGVTYTPGTGSYNSGTGDWTGLTLALGQSITLTVQGTVSASATVGSNLTNTVVAVLPTGSTLTEINAADNSASDTDVITGVPNLTLAKTGPATATQGTNYSYTLTVTNGGTVATDGTAVTVTDTLPAGLTFVSGSGGGFTCSAVAQVVTCTSSTAIAVSATAGITLIVTPSVIGSISNTAAVIGGGDTSSASSNSVTTTIVTPSDFGDAPASYDTGTAANHVIPTSPTVYLGSVAPDSETSPRTPLDGTGDDVTGTDDEGGVTLPASLTAGSTATVPVVITGSGRLNVWFDWNRNGDFGDAGEQMATDQAVTTGTTTLSIAVPSGVLLGASYARFRLCSTAGNCNTPTGAATDGEVEDYPITITVGTAGLPFACDAYFYMLHHDNGGNSQLYRVDRHLSPTYGETQIIAGGFSPAVNLNALAYNPQDGYFYAMQNTAGNYNVLYRIGQSNAVSLGVVNGLPLPGSGFFNGTFDALGNYYIRQNNSNSFYKIAISGNTANATTLTIAGVVTSGDMAFNPVDGKIYAAGKSGSNIVMSRIDLATLNVTAIPVANTVSGGSVGSLFFDTTGALYAYVDSPSYFYQLADVASGASAALQVAAAAPVSSSDGASCPFATQKLDVVESAGTATQVNATTFDIPFTIKLGNTGPIAAPNVQITENLALTFAAGTPAITLRTAPQVVAGGCTANATFDGISAGKLNLLSGTDMLATGTSCTLTFTVRVAYSTMGAVPTSTQNNTVYASTTGTANGGYSFSGGKLILPPELLDADTSTNGSTLPGSAHGDTASVTPVALSIVSDYGDVPATYDSGLAASHALLSLPTVYLGGIKPDSEAGPSSPLNGTGDDVTGSDDEDGVTLSNLIIGTTASVPVVITGNGRLNAWFDWNRDGDFADIGEQMSNDQAVTSGATNLSIAVPVGASTGASYARFRLCSTVGNCNTPTGAVSDGEVEDYPVRIAVQLSCNTLYSQSSNQIQILDPIAGTVTALTTLPAIPPSAIITSQAGALDPITKRYYYFDSSTLQLSYYDGASHVNTGITLPNPTFAIQRAGFTAAGLGYVVDYDNELYSFTTTTPPVITDLGVLDFIPAGFATSSGDIAFDSNGVGWGIFGNALWRVDVDSLSATRIGPITATPAITGNVTSLMFSATGKLYAGTATSPGRVFEVDYATGTATEVTVAGSPAYTDFATCAIPTLNPVITASKTVSPAGPVNAGATLTYAIDITNSGNVAAADVNFTDAIPANTTYVANSTKLNGVAIADISGAMPYATTQEVHSASASSGGLFVGAANKATVTFQVTVNAGASGTVSNQGTVTYDGGSGAGVLTDDPGLPGTADPSIVAIIGVPDLTLAKAGPATATLGTNYNYTLTVTNAGTAATDGTTVRVTDTLPAGLTFVSGSGVGFSCGAVGQVVTCNSNSVIAASGTAAITLTVTPTALGTLTNTADVIGGGDATTFTSTPVSTTVYGSITGTVFEDVNYGGGAGRSLAISSGVGLSAVRVELYDSTGAYIASTTTNASGAYTFDNGNVTGGVAATTYYVRVVNSTVPSSRTGYAAGFLPVQTYRTAYSGGTLSNVTDHVGGEDPSKADAGNGAATESFSTAAATLGIFTGGTLSGSQAQSIAPVQINGVVTGVDFGFNFDTIVNINDSGQGSLRQFITNANTLGGDASLAQTGQTAGIETSIFMISNGTASAGLRAAYNYTATVGTATRVATITPVTELPFLTAPVIVDGYTQPGASVNTLTVGDNAGIKVEIDGINPAHLVAVSGLTLANGSAGSAIRGLSIINFPNNGITVISSPNAVIEGNFIGLRADGGIAAGNGRGGIGLAGRITQNGIDVTDSTGVTVGGLRAASRNIVAATLGSSDISFFSGPANGFVTVSGGLIRNNYVGLDATGTLSRANPARGSGISVTSARSVSIIKNVSAGHAAYDVYLGTSTNITVQGNYLGTNAAGTAKIATRLYNLVVSNGSGNIIGGPNPGDENYCVGAGNTSIVLLYTTTANTVQRNIVGILPNGVASDTNSGIALLGRLSGLTGIVSNNLIFGNVVGNAVNGGIYLSATGTTGNAINGNFIGTDATGTANYGNAGYGIQIGYNDTAANLSSNNTISQNIITNTKGTGPGILINGVQGTSRNTITKNAIYANGGLGIDLQGTAGVSGNDGMVGAGAGVANTGIDYPVITAANLTGSTLSVGGYIGSSAAGSAAFANARVEFFIAADDGSQNGEVILADGRSVPHGEGKTYIGFCTTDGMGLFTVASCSLSNAGALGLTSATNITATATDSNGNTSEFGAVDLVPLNVTVPIKAFLQGAYDPAAGKMRDDLRKLNRFPRTQPYTGLGYTFTDGGGSETTTSAILAGIDPNNAIVDWVIVELRAAANSNVNYSRAALVQRDGDIVSPTDGVSPLTFTGLPGNRYYVAVMHRNHLGVMTKTPVTLLAGTPVVDFTTMVATTGAYGINTGNYAQVALGGGKYGLWAGDVNRSRTVTTAGASNDSSYVDSRVLLEGLNVTRSSNFAVPVYDVADTNLDGKVLTAGEGNDRGIVQWNVISHPYNSGNPNIQANQNFIIYRQYP